MMRLHELPIIEQRLLIRARLQAEIPPVPLLIAFLQRLSDRMGMHVVGEPFVLEVNRPNNMGRGVHLLVTWTEGGAKISTWEKFRYLTLSFYTCKRFKEGDVIRGFPEYFPVAEYESGWVAWWEPQIPWKR